MTPEEAARRMVAGTPLQVLRDESGAIVVRKGTVGDALQTAPVRRVAEATSSRAAAGVETVVVTSSKIKGDIQTVPIAITALSRRNS